MKQQKEEQGCSSWGGEMGKEEGDTVIHLLVASWLLPSETDCGSAVLSSCWCLDGQGVIAKSDLLSLERGVSSVGSSTLLGQPNMAQNLFKRLSWGRIGVILPLNPLDGLQREVSSSDCRDMPKLSWRDLVLGH